MITGPNADRIRLVLCDPKRVEFAGFENHPSLACEVLDESSTIARALEALTRAMESRYRTLKEAGVRSISELTGKGTRMTYVVVIIDEVSDLFLSDDGPSAKRAVVRLAQKARAVGIHVILATQRPSTDVIDGLIKANFPARIAFRTASATDSRVILGVAGAERLAGKGDALYLAAGQGRPIRVQGAFLPAFPIP
jgi:S-DNA-T family DNA segregation ATPase FtsK/SpoIIIE